MLEAIQDYCLFHRLSVDISYFAKRWMIKLDQQKFSTGWIASEDLGTAFNEAKVMYESASKK